MNKTPVSILQEMMVKKGTVPNYELIYDGGGSHVNTFTFRVSCDGFTATGTGRCKKDAKHEAAKAMLETIAKYRGYPQLPASPAQSPVRTPLPAEIPASPKIPANVPFINAIGALQDLCAENDLQEAEYHAISDVGPPHARVFTVQCIVSTFKEEGVATTKKQAKHDAAKKMLDRITDVLSELKNSDGACCYSLQKEENKKQEIMATEIAIARYMDNDLCRLPITKKNLGVKVSEYHLKVKKSFEEKERCDAIKKIDYLMTEINNITKSKSYDEFECKLKIEFEEFLMTSLSVEAKKMLLKNEDDTCPLKLMSIHLSTCPEITEIGLGKTEIKAEVHATLRILQTLKLLLKSDALQVGSDPIEKKDCSV